MHSSLVNSTEELFNILINPQSHEFALRWHRDDVKGSATEEEEKEALAVRHYGVCQVLVTINAYTLLLLSN